MKRCLLSMTATLVGIISCACLYAQGSCSPCCGSFEIGGEALYWKVCTDDRVFAVSQPEDLDDFLPHAVYPFHNRYEWGFKIFARYFTCDYCRYIGLDWIYFNGKHTNSVTAHAGDALLFPCLEPDELEPFEAARGRKSVSYNAVDLEGGQRLVFCGCGPSNSCAPCCGLSFYLLAGLRYVNLHDNYHTFFSTTQDDEERLDLNSRNRFHGGGPRLGFRCRTDVWCGLGIVGRIATSVLLGSRCSNIDFREESTESDLEETHFKTSSGGVCVSQLDAKLGVDYCFTCCGTVILEAGWAWETLLTGLGTTDLDLGTDCIVNRFHDFNIGGLYLRAAYRF